MKRNYLIWCVLFIFLMLPFQYGCEKEEIETDKTIVQAIGMPLLTMNVEDEDLGKNVEIGSNDSKSNYNLIVADDWVLTTLPVEADDSQEESEDCIQWIAEYIAGNYVDDHYVKNVFLAAGANLPYWVYSKTNMVLTILDLLWEGIVVCCPASSCELVVTSENGGITKTTESDYGFPAGYFEASTSIFVGDDVSYTYWAAALYDFSHATGFVQKTCATVTGDYLYNNVHLGHTAMIIWDERFYAQEGHHYYSTLWTSLDGTNWTLHSMTEDGLEVE